MASSARRAGAWLALAWAVTGIEDTAVLVQRVKEHEAAPEIVLDRGDKAEKHLCTDGEIKRHQVAVHEWQSRVKDIQQAKFKAVANNTAQALLNAVPLLQPLMDAVNESGVVMERSLQRSSVLVMESLLGSFIKPDNPKEKVKKIDKTSAITGYGNHFVFRTRGMVEAVLRKGLNETDHLLNMAVKEKFPQLQGHLYKGRLPSSEKEVMHYFVGKVLPVVGMAAFPDIGEVTMLFTRIAENGTVEANFIFNTLLPKIMSKLPPMCQTTRLITTLVFGAGALNDRLGKYASNCVKEVYFSKGPKLPKEPVKKCSTCEELYEDQVQNGCTEHCFPLLMTCFNGVTNACLHKAMPCVRCFKNKIERLDTCLGGDTYSELATRLDDIGQTLRTANVEEGSVDAFMNKLFSAVLP